MVLTVSPGVGNADEMTDKAVVNLSDIYASTQFTDQYDGVREGQSGSEYCSHVENLFYYSAPFNARETVEGLEARCVGWAGTYDVFRP